MLERLVPSFVACAETRQDRLDAPLFPSELHALGRAVEKRRREFITGRACARRALERLGEPAVAIPSGPRGEPLWPAGVVGSITHCRGYRACAVARAERVAALGIDAEPNLPLPAGVADDFVHGREWTLVRGRPPTGAPPVDLARLLFCAKEAVYKAWYPLTGRPLGFEDVEVALDPSGSTFTAALLLAGPVVGGVRLRGFAGRWALDDGIIGTAVVVPASAAQIAPRSTSASAPPTAP